MSEDQAQEVERQELTIQRVKIGKHPAKLLTNDQCTFLCISILAQTDGSILWEKELPQHISMPRGEK